MAVLMDKSQIKKILFISHTHIGDCLMALPTLACVRAEFPEAAIDFVAGKTPAGLFQGSPELAQVIIYDKKWNLWAKLAWVRELARKRYDLVIDLRHTLIPLLIGAKRATRLLRFKLQSRIPVRDEFLNLAAQLGLNINHQKSISLFGPSEKNRVEFKLKERGLALTDAYAVVAPGANSTTKRWTLEGFKTVMNFLVREAGMNVVLVGGEPEKKIPELLGDLKIINMVSQTSLRELAALISGAKVVIANDSSAMHIAQELGAPNVALFGPSNPWKVSRNNPRVKVVRLDLPCSPCESAQCRIERRKCLDDLSVEHVIQAVKELMEAHVQTY